MCCRVTEPVLQNLVLHFRVPAGCVKREVCLGRLQPPRRRRRRRRGRRRKGERRGEGRNFFVLDDRAATFTVFPQSGDVSATGLGGGRESIARAVARFEEIAGQKTVGEGVRVTNSTYSGRIVCRDLECERASVVQVLALYAQDRRGAGDDNVSASFRSQFFPGARLKRKSLAGALNVFNNGSYVAVGVRTRGEAEELRKWLTAIMAEFWTTLERETGCAWSAGSS